MGAEDECYCLPSMSCERLAHIEIDLLPLPVGVGIAGSLYFRNHLAVAVQQLHSEGIFTAQGSAARLALPPVTHFHLPRLAGYSEALREHIATGAIAAQESAEKPG